MSFQVQAQGENEQILLHREWMKKNMQTEFSSEARLLIAAAEAVASYSYEKENITIIAAAGNIVPGLSDYARFKSEKHLDPKESRKIKAAKDIVDTAKKKFAENAEVLSHCFYNLACLLVNFDEHGSLAAIKEACKYQHQLSSLHPKSSYTEELYLYEITQIFISLLIDGDNPQHFNKTFSLEKEILEFYKTNPESRNKAEIYSALASIKRNTGFISDSNQAHLNILFCDGYEYPAYCERNNTTTFIANGMYYYQEAVAISERTLGKYHPDAFYYRLNELYMRMGTDEFYSIDAEIENLYKYAKEYFPIGSPITADAKMAQWELYSLYDEKMDETASYSSLLKDFENYYGKNNSEYISHLERLACIRLKAGYFKNNLENDGVQLLDDFTQLSQNFFKDNVASYLLAHFNLLDIFRMYDSDRFNKKVKELVNMYTENNQHPDWKKVLFGMQFTDYINQNYYSADAVQVQELLLKEIEMIGGTEYIFYMEQNHNLAIYLESNRKPDDAEKQYKKVIELMKHKNMSIISPSIRYAEFLQNPKRIKDSEKVLVEALNDDNTDKDSPDYVMALLSLGKMYLNDKDKSLEDIKPIFEKAIPLYLSYENEMTSEMVRGYLDIASYYIYTNKKDSVEKYYLKGSEKYEAMGASYDYNHMEFNNNLFGFYLNYGEDFKAEQLTEKHINYLKESGQLNTTAYLEFLWNRVLLSQWRTPTDYLKQVHAAKPMIEHILEIYQQSGRSQDIKYNYTLKVNCFLIQVLINLCNSSDQEEIPEKNKDVFQAMINQCKTQLKDAIQALLEMEKEFPEYFKPYDCKQHAFYPLLVQTLGFYYERIEQNIEKSKLYYLLEIESNNLRHGKTSFSSRKMAKLYEAEQNWEKALYYNTQCYQSLESFPAYEQLYIINNQNQLNYTLGKYKEAAPVAMKLCEKVQTFILDNFDYISSNERSNFLNEYGNSGLGVNILLDKVPDTLSATAYNAALFDKGLLLHSWERIRHSILKSGNEHLIACMDTINRLNTQLKEINMTPDNLDQTSISTYTLQEAIERLEKNLSVQTQEFRSKNMKKRGWTDIKSKLQKNEAAIEYLLTDSNLVALIVKTDSKIPQYVNLGNAQKYYALLQSLETFPSDTKAKRLYSYGKSELYKLLWEPMEPYLKGTNTIYYSPVAFLHHISFQAIPVSSDSCLIDKYKLFRLSTTAQLVEPSDNGKIKSAVLFGGIYYSEDQSSGMQHQNLTQRAAIEEEFPYLTETSKEVDQIAGFLKEKGINVRTVKEMAGTEQSFYELDNNSPDIIHLATHGFFISGNENIEKNKFLNKYPNARYSSMQRSGLAFVGANATWQGKSVQDKEDGILTSNELSLLNLDKTDLVVLSACETGLGDVNNEGVWGLQRGFKEAGAHSMIISLWNVNDAATSLMMQEFYKKWLGGMNKQDAFTYALKTLKVNYPDPYYWASFILLDGIH